MNITKEIVIILTLTALLAIPIVWLVLQESSFFTLFGPLLYLGILVVINVIIHKTGYKPYQNKTVRTVKRIQIIIGSGFLAVFTIGVMVTLLTNQLPNHFWVFLVTLFVIGALIGYILQRMWLKYD
jgi:hypothetical protein